MYDVRGKRMRDGALSGEPWEIPGAPLSNGADPEKGGAVRLVGDVAVVAALSHCYLYTAYNTVVLRT